MKLKQVILAAIVPALVAGTGIAYAQFKKPEDAIKYRQNVYSFHFEKNFSKNKQETNIKFNYCYFFSFFFLSLIIYLIYLN